MPDEIQPALTPEEWKRLPRSVETAGMPNILDRPILTGDWPAVIALANAALPDDDPHKITREDVVDELDAYHAAVIFARWCEDNGMPDKRIEAKERAARHFWRASKLAALLPPNK